MLAILRPGVAGGPGVPAEIADLVVRDLGKTCRPSAVVAVPDLPRTRSGKIMRRVARAAYLRAEPRRSVGAREPGGRRRDRRRSRPASAASTPARTDRGGALRAVSPVQRGRPGTQLLDLGGGRQLARFGRCSWTGPIRRRLDPRAIRRVWAERRPALRPQRGSGTGRRPLDRRGRASHPASWPMRHDGLTFELRPTPSGQVGFFAEQREPWRWIRAPFGARASRAGSRPPAVLNLFAYTGGARWRPRRPVPR